MLKDISRFWSPAFSSFVLLHGLGFLELTAEFCLDEDFSMAALKLLALLSSLLKLLTLLRAGLAVLGQRRGEEDGIGERIEQGEGDRDIHLGTSSYGLGDLGGDPAGVDNGDNSSMSQNSKRISGVDGLVRPMSGMDGLLSVADSLLLWFLNDVLKLSSLAMSLAIFLSRTVDATMLSGKLPM